MERYAGESGLTIHPRILNLCYATMYHDHVQAKLKQLVDLWRQDFSKTGRPSLSGPRPPYAVTQGVHATLPTVKAPGPLAPRENLPVRAAAAPPRRAPAPAPYSLYESPRPKGTRSLAPPPPPATSLGPGTREAGFRGSQFVLDPNQLSYTRSRRGYGRTPRMHWVGRPINPSSSSPGNCQKTKYMACTIVVVFKLACKDATCPLLAAE